MTMLRYDVMDSPLGELLLLGDGEALCGLYLAGQKYRPAWNPNWRADVGVFRPAREQLQAYFAGQLTQFSLPLRPRGTAFQQAVWSALQEIGYGETRSYGALAQQLGRPGASRAVGLANGRNPLAIIVPCHRVVGSQGALTGYAGGLSRKAWLLQHERALARVGSGQRCHHAERVPASE